MILEDGIEELLDVLGCVILDRDSQIGKVLREGEDGDSTLGK